MSVRSALYAWARLLGDLNAIRRGTVGKRIKRRLLGRVFNRLMRRMVP